MIKALITTASEKKKKEQNTSNPTDSCRMFATSSEAAVSETFMAFFLFGQKIH